MQHFIERHTGALIGTVLTHKKTILMSANNAAFESNHGGLVSLHVLKKNGSSHNDLPTYLQWNTWAMTKKVCQIIHFYSGHSLFCASLFCGKVMEWKAAIKTAFKFLILVIFFCTIYSVWQVHYKINENNACESQYLMKLKCTKIRFKGITFHSRGKKKWLVSQVWSNILWRILICYVLFFFVARKILKDFLTSLHYSSGLLSDK